MFATVVILAKAATHVYGFSVVTPLLPGGWKSYSYRITEDTSQTRALYMADANDEGEEMEGTVAPGNGLDSNAIENTEETKIEIVEEGYEESESSSDPSRTEEERKPFYANEEPSIQKGESDSNDDLELDLDKVASVAGEVVSVAIDTAKLTLSALRVSAANILAASLPEEQQQDLLERLGASSAANEASAVVEAAAEMVNERVEQERASIQEEIAMARAQEAQLSTRKWERQKDEIIKEMETAANARIENELKIQKMKLEEENARALREKDQVMEAKFDRLSQEIREERDRADAMVASMKDLEASFGAPIQEDLSGEDGDFSDIDDLFAIETKEEISRKKELEAELAKRQEQKAALESVEKELRASITNEEEQRDLLQELLEKRQGQQEELDKLEGNLKIQVNEIEMEKARYQQLVADLEAVRTKEKLLRQDDQESINDSSSSSEIEPSEDDDEEDLEHPVLGPVVADLGYKRIHFVSSGRLSTVAVWNRNRTYRNNRAKSMANDKMQTMDLGFPGSICLHEAKNGKLSIVDGQHRVGMMASLKGLINKKIEKGQDLGSLKDADEIFEKVLVEVYPEPKNSVGKDVLAEKVFLEINKAEPVKLIDMPGVASSADRQIITEAVETLQDQFSDMFSSSQRCRVPNVNIDNFRSMVFGANLLKKHNLTTSKKLTEWLMEQNAALGNEYENDPSKQKLVSKKQFQKASNNNFYLGLESSWLYK